MPKYVVRYGVMRRLGVFAARGRDAYARGHRVIARTPRGQELGEVLCEATEAALAQMENDPAQGQIVRLVTGDDDGELRRLEELRGADHAAAKAAIAESGLPMKLVDVERLYGGERVVVYYLSEDRVDFRELVKTLASAVKTRVEMRQIGVRDEAKLLADYGDCGKPVCCNTHLGEMPPVSMKMAKLQKATLDPTKISGRCGRLKCCLRYEYDTYRELQQELPRVGAQVLTRDGRAKVLSQELLTSELLVETEDGRRVVIRAADVLSTVPAKPGAAPSETGPDRPPAPRPANRGGPDRPPDSPGSAAGEGERAPQPRGEPQRPRDPGPADGMSPAGATGPAGARGPAGESAGGAAPGERPKRPRRRRRRPPGGGGPGDPPRSE